ncbi:MAG: metN, partial [Bacillus sp. (in: firmicutes)]|nr:metN [Bacillus sp. (in: firmicutes)]
AGESIISDTLQLFKVKGNFLHGSIEYIQELPLGIFIMEIDGERSEINNAIKYIENRFAQVEVLRDGL